MQNEEPLSDFFYCSLKHINVRFVVLFILPAFNSPRKGLKPKT